MRIFSYEELDELGEGLIVNFEYRAPLARETSPTLTEI